MDSWLSQGLPRKRCGAPLTDSWSGCYSCCLPAVFSGCDIVRHDAPYEAGKFSGNSRNRYILFLFVADHPVILAPKPDVRSVSISDDFRPVSFLPGTQLLGFVSYLPLADPPGPLNQKLPQMRIPSLGYPGAVDLCSAGEFSRCKPKECGIGVAFCKAVEISGFHDQ